MSGRVVVVAHGARVVVVFANALIAGGIVDWIRFKISCGKQLMLRWLLLLLQRRHNLAGHHTSLARRRGASSGVCCNYLVMLCRCHLQRRL